MASGDPPLIRWSIGGPIFDRKQFTNGLTAGIGPDEKSIAFARLSEWSRQETARAYGLTAEQLGVEEQRDDALQTYVKEALGATLRAEERAIMGAPVSLTYAGTGLSRFSESVARMQEEAEARSRAINRERGLAGLKEALLPLGIVDVIPDRYGGGVLPLTMVREDGTRIYGGVTDFDMQAPEPLARLKAEIRAVNERQGRRGFDSKPEEIKAFDSEVMLARLGRYGVKSITTYPVTRLAYDFKLDFEDGAEMEVSIPYSECFVNGPLSNIEAKIAERRGIEVGELPPVMREIEAVAVVPYTSRQRRTL